MNPIDDFLDELDEDEREEAWRSKIAIECRAVRMFIAKNPGTSAFDIKKSVGGRVDLALNKMLGMKIIQLKVMLNSEGRRCRRWYVVPQ